MAAFLTRGFGYTAGAGTDQFTDDDTSVFEKDIDRLATAGVTKGCNPPVNDRYCPDDLVKRDQMASFLGRALGLTAMTPPPPTTTTTTTTTTSTTVPPTTKSVSIGEFFFSPNPIIVSAGDMIRWTNNGAMSHTTTSGVSPFPNGVWNSGVLYPGASFSRTFSSAGTFQYFCLDPSGLDAGHGDRSGLMPWGLLVRGDLGADGRP